MKALKKYLAVLLLGLLVLVGAACKNNKEPEHTAPELTVAEASVSGKVREAIALPTATAKDYLEQDISGNIRIRIYFQEDEEYVLPQKNASLGVPLSQNPTFTPTKCGEYKITYFVADEKDFTTEKGVSLTVNANTDSELAQNLASVQNTGNWLYGDAEQNSALNGFGEITIAGKSESTAYGGASYKGEKIKNGDTVTVDFIAEEPNNVWFYDIAYLLTKSAGEDAPVAGECSWPSYFHIRIVKNQIEAYLYTLAGNVNYPLFDVVSVGLLDGQQHSLSLKLEVSEEQIDASLWIDKAVTASPSATNTIYKEDVTAKNPDNADALKPFDPNVTGWLSFGANITGKNITNDRMIIKGVTINGATELKTPSVNVAEMSKMLIETQTTLPAVTARDENDYSDLTSAVKLYIKAPNGEFEETTEKTYTPAAAGEYIFRYTVTDQRGNLGYKEFSVLCSKGESTAAPVIDFGEEIEDKVTVKLNEVTDIPVPVSVTDSFGDDISSRLKVELIGREKADLAGVSEFVFRAAGKNILRYSVADYNGVETVLDIEVTVTESATGNILERGEDWYFNKATYDEAADTVQIDATGALAVYGGQKIYDEKVSVLWNYDIASTAGGADGTNILMINLRGGKSQETVKTPNNPEGSTSWGWPEGLTVVISRHYGILIKLGGWNAASIGTSVKQPNELVALFSGKDTVLSFQATDVIGDNGEIEGVRIEVFVDGERIAFSGSYLDEDGNVLLNKRYLRVNPSVLEAGWLDFYFNDVDTVSDPAEKTIIKAITVDGTAPVQTIVSIDKEDNQEFVMNEEYTLPVVTVTVGEEDKSAEVKKYLAVVGEEPDFEADPYAEETITPGIEYIKGFVVYYVFNGKVIKTVTVSNSSEVEVTLDTQEVTGAKVYTAFTLPAVQTAMLGSLDVAADITAKVKIGVFEYDAEAAYTPTSDEPVVINYYFYGKIVKTLAVQVAPDVAGTVDFAQCASLTGGNAISWKSQKIYNNKINLRFSFKQAFAAGDLYEFTLRGGETSAGAWMSYPTGLNLSLFKDDKGVFFRVHSNPSGIFPQTVYGVSSACSSEIDWSLRHTLTYSVYDKYDEEKNFLGVTVEVWLDGAKVEFTKGADGAATTDGSVLIPAQTVLANPKDGKGQTIFTDSYFAVFGMAKGATINGALNVHHAYIMKPTDELPAMPEDPAAFEIDKEEDQTFTMGEEYTLPVLTATVNGVPSTKPVTVYIKMGGGTPDLNVDEAHEGATFTPDADCYKGFTVHYVYDGAVVKSVFVANSAKVAITLDPEEITGAQAGTAIVIPTITEATLSGVDVKGEITVKIKLGDSEIEAGETYTPLAAGTIEIIYYFGGEVVKSVTVEVAEGEQELTLTLSAEEVTAQIGTAFTVPTVVSATLGENDFKDEISVKLKIGQNEIEAPETYTPWFDGMIYIVYSYGTEVIKTLEVPVPPVTNAKTDIASQFEETGHKAARYNKQFLYNNRVYLNFIMDEEFAAGDIYDFGLRGGEQSQSAWCGYSQGLRIQITRDAAWGVYFSVGYGNNAAWLATKLAESSNKYGSGANVTSGYVDVDWTKPHTLVYGAYDVFDDDGAYRGIMVELLLDGTPVAFGTAQNNAVIENGKVLIPVSEIEKDPKDTTGVSVFDKSLFFIWNNNSKTVTINRAHILSMTDELPKEPVDITQGGGNTGSGGWSYTAQKLMNRKVDLTFSLDKTATIMQFGLRGSSENAGHWFDNGNNGLILGIYHDDTWGECFKITYGENQRNSFGEGKRPDGAKIEADWTEEHTLSYAVWNVYDENDEVTGIKVTVVFDGVQLRFSGADELLITKEAYMEKVNAETNPIEIGAFERSSFVFANPNNGSKFNVTSATLLEL